MYAKGMSQRAIADTSENIYGCDMSDETISAIKELVLAQLEKGHMSTLKRFHIIFLEHSHYLSIVIE